MAITQQQMIEHRLKWLIESGNQARAQVANEILKDNSSAMYQLRWLNGKHETIATGALAETISQSIENLQNDEQLGFDDALAKMVDYLKRSKDRWSPEHSTSPFSNVMHEAEFEAYNRVLQTLGAR